MGSAMRGLAFGAAVALLAAGAGAPALAQTGTATTAPTTTKPATTKDSSAPPAEKARVATKSGASKDPVARPAKSAAAKPSTPAKPAAPTAAPKPGPSVTVAAPAAAKAAGAPPATRTAAPPPQLATPLRDATPSVAPLPGAPAPVAVSVTSYRQSHPLLGAFLTGLLGVGLADSLLGVAATEAGGSAETKPGNLLEPVASGLDTAEFAGQITRLLLFGALVALAVFAWRRSTASAPSRPAVRQRRSAPALSGLDDVEPDYNEPVLEPPTHPEALKAIADEQDFADILLIVQAGWSEGNVMAMSAHITPDMATWFDRRLAQNAENGVENRVVDVSNIRVERLADWEASGLHFARARMRWRAIDYVIDLARLPDEPGYIIDGSPEEPMECEEVWTFVKSPDGAWVLSEIEHSR